MTFMEMHDFFFIITSFNPKGIRTVNKQEQTSIKFEKQNNIPLSARVHFILFAVKLAFGWAL